MSRAYRSPAAVESINLGFQIAPLVDVVFVILLFFLVMAGAMRADQRLDMQLPGVNPLPLNAEIPPTEITISITDDNHILLNEAQLDTGTQGPLPGLTVALARLQQEASARQDAVLVTIEADAESSFQRITDVMNALAVAGLKHVTFSVSQPD